MYVLWVTVIFLLTLTLGDVVAVPYVNVTHLSAVILGAILPAAVVAVYVLLATWFIMPVEAFVADLRYPLVVIVQ